MMALNLGLRKNILPHLRYLLKGVKDEAGKMSIEQVIIFSKNSSKTRNTASTFPKLIAHATKHKQMGVLLKKIASY